MTHVATFTFSLEKQIISALKKMLEGIQGSNLNVQTFHIDDVVQTDISNNLTCSVDEIKQFHNDQDVISLSEP